MLVDGVGNKSVDDGCADVLLLGGPGDIPGTMRLGRAAIVDGKVKIAHRGGYEHFELVGDSLPVVFRWTMRTKIAE